jgi:hypothetical protein
LYGRLFRPPRGLKRADMQKNPGASASSIILSAWIEKMSLRNCLGAQTAALVCIGAPGANRSKAPQDFSRWKWKCFCPSFPLPMPDTTGRHKEYAGM